MKTILESIYNKLNDNFQLGYREIFISVLPVTFANNTYEQKLLHITLMKYGNI